MPHEQAFYGMAPMSPDAAETQIVRHGEVAPDKDNTIKQ